MSNRIVFGEGIYRFSDIELHKDYHIGGIPGKTIINAVLKKPGIASCNKDVFIIKNCKEAMVRGITFKGDLQREWKAKYGGGTFISCENVEKVIVESCVFTESNNYSLGEGKDYKGALINCYDCNDITIEKCSFSKSVKTEHIYIDVKTKKDLNVMFVSRITMFLILINFIVVLAAIQF